MEILKLTGCYIFQIGKKVPSFFGNLGRSLQEKGVYNTWMFQEQDLIQSFAHTYADRIIAEAFGDVINVREVKGTSLEGVMDKVFQLHLLSTLERDLAWFIENEVLTAAQGEKVGDTEYSINVLSDHKCSPGLSSMASPHTYLNYQ